MSLCLLPSPVSGRAEDVCTEDLRDLASTRVLI
jgi:hypothetical protein